MMTVAAAWLRYLGHVFCAVFLVVLASAALIAAAGIVLCVAWCVAGIAVIIAGGVFVVGIIGSPVLPAFMGVAKLPGMKFTRKHGPGIRVQQRGVPTDPGSES